MSKPDPKDLEYLYYCEGHARQLAHSTPIPSAIAYDCTYRQGVAHVLGRLDAARLHLRGQVELQEELDRLINSPTKGVM